MNKKEIVDYTRNILSEAYTGVFSNNKKQPISDQSHVTNIVVVNKGPSIVLIAVVFICILCLCSVVPIKAVICHQIIQRVPKNNVFFKCTSRSAEPVNSKTDKQISRFQANEIKDLIKKLSQKEQKTPNMIHRELKKMYNYARYREINSRQYYQIKQALLNRLQY